MSTKLTVEEIHRLYAAGDATPSEIVRAAIEKIEADNERLNAYLTINREGALNQAATLDGAIQSAMQTQPLAGVPVAIKDNMCTEGVRTTCGSRILGNYVPQY
ncbi:MAG TPA: amidase family protein, partial [Blastocatellia bacterium]|nr:amidase family protein [Blastocatellia bacterium]